VKKLPGTQLLRTPDTLGPGKPAGHTRIYRTNPDPPAAFIAGVADRTGPL